MLSRIPVCLKKQGQQDLSVSLGMRRSLEENDTFVIRGAGRLESSSYKATKQEKAFRDANEITNLCEEIGADIEDVAAGMGYDNRIGNKFLRAGIGYGGSCFPKDTKALHWLSDYHEQELKTVKAAIEVNNHQKLKLIRKAHKYYEDLEGVTVAVLGLTFKPGTDDLREAPSLANVPMLLEEGAIVRVYDPVGMERFKELYPTQVKYCKSAEEALRGAELCLILTDWPKIKEISLKKFAELMTKPVILDGRNCHEVDEAMAAEVIYDSM